MPIPAFNIDGIIPPFIGPRGPGDASQFMTPFASTAEEIVARFGTTDNRREILKGWLAHRALLYGLDIRVGFQWLDGSFLEDKVPGDLDIVTFFHRPPTARDRNAFRPIFLGNPRVFHRPTAKAEFRLDIFSIDMDATPTVTVDTCAYYLGLFSHTRGGSLWKGMLRVALDANDDAVALTALNNLTNAQQPAAVAP